MINIINDQDVFNMVSGGGGYCICYSKSPKKEGPIGFDLKNEKDQIFSQKDVSKKTCDNLCCVTLKAAAYLHYESPFTTLADCPTQSVIDIGTIAYKKTVDLFS